MNKIPMTKRGEQSLRVELERLKGHDRPRVIQAIAEARAHGDLKENAEYHAAREQQSFIEGRIAEIESKLSHCQVIDVTQVQGGAKVIFGATVTLLNLETESTLQYQIVGEDEADIKSGKVSVTSPIARAVVGKVKEEVVIVSTPSGTVEYEIIAVDYI